MNEYLSWDEQTITDFSPENIDAMYNRGFVFGRPENGHMEQTRSIRIDLSQFELSSENKRILRKTEGLDMNIVTLPYSQYTWDIGKMGKDFYETKFGDGTFSANKIKELLTGDRNDFNRVLIYSSPYQGELEGVNNKEDAQSSVDPSQPPLIGEESQIGYCIAVETKDMLHYSYPFYNLNSEIKNLGMGMMIRAVVYAKEAGKQYIYLGSFQRPTDVYKLQFSGMEWFDGKKWQNDTDTLKNTIPLC
jgi:arginyl-tRNA--protein-N-Asp/Glu arginylyltransferase